MELNTNHFVLGAGSLALSGLVITGFDADAAYASYNPCHDVPDWTPCMLNASELQSGDKAIHYGPINVDGWINSADVTIAGWGEVTTDGGWNNTEIFGFGVVSDGELSLGSEVTSCGRRYQDGSLDGRQVDVAINGTIRNSVINGVGDVRVNNAVTNRSTGSTTVVRAGRNVRAATYPRDNVMVESQQPEKTAAQCYKKFEQFFGNGHDANLGAAVTADTFLGSSLNNLSPRQEQSLSYISDVSFLAAVALETSSR